MPFRKKQLQKLKFEEKDPYIPVNAKVFSQDSLVIHESGIKSSKFKKQINNRQSIDSKSVEIIEKLGSGAQGDVFKAIIKDMDEYIALKRFNVFKQDDQQIVKKEVELLLNCHNDNVIECYGAYFKEGQVNIGLEFMDLGCGSHLIGKQANDKKFIPEKILGCIAVQILNGIYYQHKRINIIHRDIKPDNILFNSNGEVKISDFGVSKKGFESNFMTHSFAGSQKYMSPDRLNNETDCLYGCKTDIWAFGITMLEFAQLEYPYAKYFKDGMLDGVGQPLVIKNQRPAALPSHYSSELKDLIEKCLTIDIEKRPKAEDQLYDPFIQKYNIKGQFEHQKTEFQYWLDPTSNVKIVHGVNQISSQSDNKHQVTALTGYKKGLSDETEGNDNIYDNGFQHDYSTKSDETPNMNTSMISGGLTLSVIDKDAQQVIKEENPEYFMDHVDTPVQHQRRKTEPSNILMTNISPLKNPDEIMDALHGDTHQIFKKKSPEKGILHQNLTKSEFY